MQSFNFLFGMAPNVTMASTTLIHALKSSSTLVFMHILRSKSINSPSTPSVANLKLNLMTSLRSVNSWDKLLSSPEASVFPFEVLLPPRDADLRAVLAALYASRNHVVRSGNIS